MAPEVLRSECVGKWSDVYSFAIILWELLHNELAWKRSGPQAAQGFNARVLVEMVAYRRARPPIKERVVDPVPNGVAALIAAAEEKSKIAGTISAPNSPAGVVPAPPPPAPLKPLGANAARIDSQAFAGGLNNLTHPISSIPGVNNNQTHLPNSRPGVHPVLVTLLREMWRDDYQRRPSFDQIVNRLTAFREMIRAQHKMKKQQH
jgi:hypothetical protein